MSHWALDTPVARRLLEQIDNASRDDWNHLRHLAERNHDSHAHARSRQRILLWAGDYLAESVRHACATRLPADAHPIVRHTVPPAITALLLSQVVVGDEARLRDDVTITTAAVRSVFDVADSTRATPEDHPTPTVTPTPSNPLEIEQVNPPMRTSSRTDGDGLTAHIQQFRRQRAQHDARQRAHATFTHANRIARLWIQQSGQPVAEFTRQALGMFHFLTSRDSLGDTPTPTTVAVTARHLLTALDDPELFPPGPPTGTRIPRADSPARAMGTLLLRVETTAPAEVSRHHDVSAFHIFQQVLRLPAPQRADLDDELQRVLDQLIESPPLAAPPAPGLTPTRIAVDGGANLEPDGLTQTPATRVVSSVADTGLRSTSHAPSRVLDLSAAHGVLAQLDTLPGLSGVTDVLKQQVATVVVDRERESRGLPTTTHSHHMVFTGPPGTGKTTVARHVGELYRALGILSRGHTVEVDRSALVGEYLGSTTKKTMTALERASGGVLFIDEAYALIESGYSRGDAFGREALNTVVKHIEDHRGDLVVILAGYPEPMDQFLHTNPGLVSRIALSVPFSSYTPRQLGEILDHTTGERGLHLDATGRRVAEEVFTRHADSDDFGNARGVRNLVDAAQRAHAWRLCDRVGQVSDEDLMTLTADDIHHAEQSLFPAPHHVRAHSSTDVAAGAYL